MLHLEASCQAFKIDMLCSVDDSTKVINRTSFKGMLLLIISSIFTHGGHIFFCDVPILIRYPAGCVVTVNW